MDVPEPQMTTFVTSVGADDLNVTKSEVADFFRRHYDHRDKK